MYASLSLGYKTNRFSSNNEYGTVRVLHHPRRHAPEEKPGNGPQPFGTHHDQIGLLSGGRLHDLFSRVPKVAQWFGCKSRLDKPASFNPGYMTNGSTWNTLT